ncbi:MAG TPA: choice-of-anchor V domain-containing protein [Thermodesulfobacteriota bacterium]|nr:choice-of-anchor V domain-containing protein [Thermodesulfobacteriota bacterium]
MKKLCRCVPLVLVVAIASLLGFSISRVYGSANSAPTMDCLSCHVGEIVPDLAQVEGWPKAYTPGKTYEMTVLVKNGPPIEEGEAAGGFVVKVSAGQLIVSDKQNTQIIDQLLTHTQEGKKLRKWTFKWKAPTQKKEVSLHILAMAANGDASANGDQVGEIKSTIQAAK